PASPRSLTVEMSSRKCRAALNASFDFAQDYALARFDRTRDGDHHAHRRKAVIDCRAMLRRAVQDRVGEPFDLPFVTVGILTQWAMKLSIFRGETFHVARFVEPGKEHVPFYTA